MRTARGENNGWARENRRRRSRVTSGPKTQLRPRELGCPSHQHHGDGPRGPHRHPENSGQQRTATWTRGAQRAPICNGEKVSSSLPCLLLSFSWLEVSLEKLSMVFLPEKKCLRTWVSGPRAGPVWLLLWWLESLRTRPASCAAEAAACGPPLHRRPGGRVSAQGRWAFLMSRQCPPGHPEPSIVQLP